MENEIRGRLCDECTRKIFAGEMKRGAGLCGACDALMRKLQAEEAAGGPVPPSTVVH
jgi:hypothetical protein